MLSKDAEIGNGIGSVFIVSSASCSEKGSSFAHFREPVAGTTLLASTFVDTLRDINLASRSGTCSVYIASGCGKMF